MPGALAIIAAAAAGFAIRGLVERRSHEQHELAAAEQMHAHLHRLKNPLQSIILQAELLPSAGPEAAEIRAAIIGEAERVAAILAEQAGDAAGEAMLG